MMMSGNEVWKKSVFARRRKVDRDGADITLSGRLFLVVGPATGKVTNCVANYCIGSSAAIGVQNARNQ